MFIDDIDDIDEYSGTLSRHEETMLETLYVKFCCYTNKEENIVDETSPLINIIMHKYFRLLGIPQIQKILFTLPFHPLQQQQPQPPPSWP